MGWDGPTHRQFEATVAWVDLQWNVPTRTDWYLMLIACEVRRVLAKAPGQIKVKQMLMKFETGGSDNTQSVMERRRKMVELSKQQAIGLVGLASRGLRAAAKAVGFRRDKE